MADTPDLPLILGLRTWRTWLLTVTGLGQGVQYILAPQRQLTTQAYLHLQWLGVDGWRGFGGLFIVYALLLIARTTRPAGHTLGALLYLALFWACVFAHYWPTGSILGAGLNIGEFWLWQRTQPRPGG